jgi:phage gp29-like protein
MATAPSAIVVHDPPSRKEPVQSPFDTGSTHPASGLEIPILISILREAEAGSPLRQFDLFDDSLEVDGHLRSHFEGRIQSSAGAEWVIQSGRPGDPVSDDAALRLNAGLREMAEIDHVASFEDWIEHQLTAPGYGFACSHTRWELGTDSILPVQFTNVAHRRFAAPSADRASEIWLIDGKSAKDLVPLEAGAWAVTRYRHRNPYAAGLLRTAVFWSLFKRLAFRDWQVFADMFGLPYIVGQYDEGASQATRDALKDSVQNIGSDGWAVLSKAAEIHVVSGRSGDPSSVFPRLATASDDEISKVFAGGTLNTDVDGKGSYAMGAVHESRANALIRSDAHRVESTFTRDIGRWFVAYNSLTGAAPPRLHIQIARDTFPRAQTVGIIGQIIGLDESQLREEFGFRAPSDGTGVKMPSKAQPKEGGDQ